MNQVNKLVTNLPKMEIQNSWNVSIFDPNKKSFFNMLICRCGTTKKTHVLEYIKCDSCNNKNFLDLGKFENKIKYSEIIDFNWYIENKIRDNGWYVKTYFYLPCYNTSLNSINFKETILISFFITQDKKFDWSSPLNPCIYEYLIRKNNTIKSMKDLLTKQLMKSMCNLIYINPPKETKEKILSIDISIIPEIRIFKYAEIICNC